MSQQNNKPSKDTVQAVLDVLTPYHTGFSIQTLAGSYSNHTHLVNVEFANTPTQRIVLRRYNEANGDCIGKARREFEALKLLQKQGFPAPKVLYLDDDGKLLGSPGIITEFVEGKQIDLGSNSKEWADNIETVAQMLAKIHMTVYDHSIKSLLMDGNTEVAWFLKSETMPNFMNNHPDGATVWNIVSELMPQAPEVKPVFLHIDYWSGNILWHKGKISAVVDWEEAGYGDPSIDVAYCRMELYLAGLEDIAEKFLQIYEETIGQSTINLGIWELAAAARPMYNPDSWFTERIVSERFQRFITDAKARATA